MDIQPGLHVVLSETQGANVTRHVHSLRGIHAHKDASNNWEWPLQDGLGSVREVVDNNLGVLESRNYDPFGTGFGTTGTSQTNYGFTGELLDGGGLLDLRARRYAPGLGVFASLDPLETPNRYAYVSGNPVNITDPTGLQEDCYFIGEELICGIQILPTTPPDTEYHMYDKRRDDCRRRENQHKQECRDYWDEQDPPKQCGCETNRHPASTVPFQNVGDLLCNLNCYNGLWNVGLYLLASNNGMGVARLESPYIDRTSIALGQFTPYEGIDFHGRSVSDRGGLIEVRQPSGIYALWRSRASVMATFVEEINHAAHYHNLLRVFGVPSCNSITIAESETAAKVAKGAWVILNIALGDIPLFAFSNLLMSEIADIPNNLRKYDLRYAEQKMSIQDLAFTNCPSSGVSPKKWSRKKGDTLKKGRHQNGQNQSEIRPTVQVRSRPVTGDQQQKREPN